MIPKHKDIFRRLIPYFGRIRSAVFYRRTRDHVPGVDLVHPLIEGIYKPAWSDYALSVSSMLKSPYRDQVIVGRGGTWAIHYSPKAGDMKGAVNASLIRCMSDRVPVLVLEQVSDTRGPSGARHRLLGLGLIEALDVNLDLFRIRGLEWSEISKYLGLKMGDEFIGPALRLEGLNDWAPFVVENRAVYQFSAEKREAGFRAVILENYGFKCAVTGLRYYSTNHTEASAAHIIRKADRGTDDPRNGLALSQTSHWAFDAGIFTISDQYEMVVNPKARHARIESFPLLELDRKQIRLPSDQRYWPHLEALAWHKKEVYDKFKL